MFQDFVNGTIFFTLPIVVSWLAGNYFYGSKTFYTATKSASSAHDLFLGAGFWIAIVLSAVFDHLESGATSFSIFVIIYAVFNKFFGSRTPRSNVKDWIAQNTAS